MIADLLNFGFLNGHLYGLRLVRWDEVTQILIACNDWISLSWRTVGHNIIFEYKLYDLAFDLDFIYLSWE